MIEEGFLFYISHYSFWQLNIIQTTVRHIRLRQTTNPIILYYYHVDYQIHVLEVHYKVTKRIEIVKINVVVCYSYYLYHE